VDAGSDAVAGTVKTNPTFLGIGSNGKVCDHDVI
jgi:hypothetical protein